MSDWNYEILKYFSILPTIQDNIQNGVSVRMCHTIKHIIFNKLTSVID